MDNILIMSNGKKSRELRTVRELEMSSASSRHLEMDNLVTLP